MQSAIDFGKNFLTEYFNRRNADAAAANLADDVIWITPNEIRHLRSRKSVHDFIVSSLEDDQNAYSVDVAAVLSVPNLDADSIVVFEINLIPKMKETSVNLRCTLGMRRLRDGYEIAYIGMSRKYNRTDTEQIRSFADALPGGIMTLTTGRGTLRLMYASAFFLKKLDWDEETFYQKADANPFFMLLPEEQRHMQTLVAEMGALKNPRPLSMQVTLVSSDGSTQIPCQVTLASAYKDGGQTMLYLLFDELTDLLREMERKKRKEQREWKASMAKQPAIEKKDVAEEASRRDSRPELDRQIEEIRRDAEKQIASVQIEANVRLEEAYRLAAEEADAAEKLIRVKLEQAAKEQQEAVEKTRRSLSDQYTQAREQEQQRWRSQKEELTAQLQQAQEAVSENAQLKEKLEALEGSRRESERSYEDRILQLEWQLQKSAGEEEERRRSLTAQIQEECRRELDQQKEKLEMQRQQMQAQLEQERAQSRKKEAELTGLISRQQQEMKAQEAALRKSDADLHAQSRQKDKSFRRMETLLRGDLNGVCSIARSAGEEESAPALRGKLERISGIADSALPLVKDLGGTAALDPGKRAVRREKFNLSSCLELSRRVCKPMCREKGIIFSVGTGKNLPEKVIGDKAGLELALLCILENAVEHTLSGGRITLSASADTPVRTKSYCRFTVTDTGEGIPEDRLTALFDDPQSELSAAQKVIAAMGGSIQVRSKAGEGSTFEIRVSLELQEN